MINAAYDAFLHCGKSSDGVKQLLIAKQRREACRQ